MTNTHQQQPASANEQNITLEICAASVASCLAAQAGGAQRIELCDNLLEGGTTPSYATIALAREKVHLDLYPIIRPRGGDFLYDDLEFEVMKKDIQLCKSLGCNGVVIGLLTADGKIDTERTKALVELAWPLGVTFHRAFDMTANAEQALEDIISTGCERVLSSGQRNTATEGIPLLQALVKQAAGRIAIMVGAGVRAANIAELVKGTGALEYHTTARAYTDSRMQYRNPNVSMGGIPGVPEYGISLTRADQVKLIRELAQKALTGK